MARSSDHSYEGASRRRFLGALATGSVALGAWSAPSGRHARCAGAAKPGKGEDPAMRAALELDPEATLADVEPIRLDSVETFTRGPVSVVRVVSDRGEEGFGQTAPFNADISALVVHRQIAPHALRRPVGRIAEFVDRTVEENYKFPGSYVRRALTGVETALWDLRARRAGKRVCELLGGKPGPVVAYGSSMRRDIKPEDEAARLVQLRGDKGLRAFKVRIGRRTGHDQDQWPGRTEALVKTVRKAVGPEVALLVDANSCYTPPKAIAVGRFLGEYGVCHFEEPCPYWEYEWTAEVTRAIDVPVAGGEQDCLLPGWRRMIEMHAVDIVQPDVCYVGGMVRAMRVAAMGALAGMPCVPHSANLSLVTVFTMHLLRSIDNAGPHLEFSIEPTAWTADIYRPLLEVKDGQVAFPEGPGWGVTIDRQWLEKAEHQITRRS